VVAGVAGAKAADHLGGALTVGKAGLGLATERRPGAGAGPAGVADAVADPLQVKLERSGAPPIEAPGRAPEVHQAGDQVASGAAEKKLARAVLGAESDDHPAGKVLDPNPRPFGPPPGRAASLGERRVPANSSPLSRRGSRPAGAPR
jgi:hypothetical protein